MAATQMPQAKGRGQGPCQDRDWAQSSAGLSVPGVRGSLGESPEPADPSGAGQALSASACPAASPCCPPRPHLSSRCLLSSLFSVTLACRPAAQKATAQPGQARPAGAAGAAHFPTAGKGRVCSWEPRDGAGRGRNELILAASVCVHGRVHPRAVLTCRNPPVQPAMKTCV